MVICLNVIYVEYIVFDHLLFNHIDEKSEINI